MRILGFSKHWDKLKQSEFTTFRVPRKDKDWQEGEVVQIVYRPRSKEREAMGIAQIISKKPKDFSKITHNEALADGFVSIIDMWNWLSKAHKGFMATNPINKLTLRRIKEMESR